MKFSIINKIKIWIILTLVVVVSGLTLFGFLGFNKATADDVCYEVIVSVDQDVKDSASKAEEFSKEFFESKNLKYSNYSTQKVGFNNKLIFKFDTDVSEAIAGLEEYIEEKINDEERDVEVVLYQAESKLNFSILKTLLGVLIVVGAIFIVSLIAFKFKSSLAIIASSIVSFVIFLSLMAITRIPALPFVFISTIMAIVLSAVLSTNIVHGYNEIEKNSVDEKLSSSEIADASVSSKLVSILVFVISLLLFSVGLSFALGYGLFLALQLLVLNVSAVYSAIVITPLLLATLKKNK